MKISFVILISQQNIEKIPQKQKQLQRVADEIIFIVNAKKQKIPALKKSKVFFDSKKDFSHLRELGRKKASSDWIFYLDADEKLSEELIYQIKKLKKNNQIKQDVFYIPRVDIFWGKKVLYGEVLKQRKRGIIRLIKKSSKGKWQGRVHERFTKFEKSGRLEGEILHFAHPNTASFLRKIIFYSDLRASEIKRRIYLIEVVFVPILKFIHTFIFYLGFLDGARGAVYSFIMSFYSFLTRAKLYAKQNLE